VTLRTSNQRSGRTLSRIDPNAAPSAAALGFGSSWLAYREANLVVRVDSSGATTSIPVGRGPSAIAVGRRAVWVANAIDGTVESIDPATGAAIMTFHVGSAPTAIVADGGNPLIKAARDLDARVVVVDADEPEVLRTLLSNRDAFTKSHRRRRQPRTPSTSLVKRNPRLYNTRHSAGVTNGDTET